MTDEHDGRTTLREVFSAVREPTLTDEELRLWLLYRSYESPDGRGAWPGDELLAKHLGRSPRTVQRHRRQLLKKGWLRQELRGPKPAAYHTVLPKESPHLANLPDESLDRSGEASPERVATSGEATKGSPKGSPEGSPNPSSPYKEENGEYGKNTETGSQGGDGGESDSPPSWPSPADLPSDDGTGHLQYPDPFERVWDAYPRHRGKKAAYRKVRSLVRDGTDPDQLREAAEKYARRMEAEDREEQHMKLARTFFGPDDWWREELENDEPASSGGPHYLGNRL